MELVPTVLPIVKSVLLPLFVPDVKLEKDLLEETVILPKLVMNLV